MGGDAVFSIFRGKCFSRKLDFFLFNLNFQLILGARGFRMTRCGPLVAPLLRPLWPAMARLWPLVARCGPLVAPCGPFVFYGRTFEKFSRGPLCGPPGHPKFFKGSDFWFFFHFSADGLRGEEKKELYFLFSFYTVDRRPKNEKNEKSEPLKNFGWPGGPVARTAGHAKIFQRFARRKQRGHKGP